MDTFFVGTTVEEWSERQVIGAFRKLDSVSIVHVLVHLPAARPSVDIASHHLGSAHNGGRIFDAMVSIE